MVNVEVKEFKIKINNIECTFRLDFRALIKLNNKFENAMDIFNAFLNNQDTYGCIVKILSCACVERDFTEEELIKYLSFDYKTIRLMDEITFALIEGVMGEKEGKKKTKNE